MHSNPETCPTAPLGQPEADPPASVPDRRPGATAANATQPQAPNAGPATQH